MPVKIIVGDGWQLGSASEDAEHEANQYLQSLTEEKVVSITTNILTEPERDGVGTLYSVVLTIFTEEQ